MLEEPEEVDEPEELEELGELESFDEPEEESELEEPGELEESESFDEPDSDSDSEEPEELDEPESDELEEPDELELLDEPEELELELCSSLQLSGSLMSLTSPITCDTFVEGFVATTVVVVCWQLQSISAGTALVVSWAQTKYSNPCPQKFPPSLISAAFKQIVSHPMTTAREPSGHFGSHVQLHARVHDMFFGMIIQKPT